MSSSKSKSGSAKPKSKQSTTTTPHKSTASRNDDSSTLVQIESDEHWERLQGNFVDAIERVLDEELGPTASASARNALRQHLVAWKESTFHDAKPNAQINEVVPAAADLSSDPAGPDDDMEPFDDVLNHDVYALEEERMRWEETISAYRRNAPGELREMTEGMLSYENEMEYEGRGPEAVLRDNEEDDDNQDDKDMDIKPLANLGDVKATHARTLQQTRRILEAAPSLEERATRAPIVVEKLSQL
ncbi:hypothetical protein DL93DRAFT_2163228 [Clavulina sp. PMI_390]|nr:hypothetical protein DL93DRAFT_2163228 [Clavulina sp. PMI_390]